MKVRILIALSLVATLIASVPVAGSAAPRVDMTSKIKLSGTERIERMGLPDQADSSEAEDAIDAATTDQPQCNTGATEDAVVLTLPSFDPAHPESQDVVFQLETPADAPGRARIWVAWDYLQPDWGTEPDKITCEQIDYLAAAADKIIETDVHYFGDYEARGDGGQNIDIFTYNIVDEFFYDEDFESFIAGFFSSDFQEEFDRNAFFLDSVTWSYGLGPDADRPNDVEATFAHELEHLIMNDHDADEVSWVDEGLADLAIYLNGYGHDTFHVIYYLLFHRNSLTGWDSTLEDYGASYLFQLYLLENFGEQVDGVWDNTWTRAMVDEASNGIDGVEDRTGADFRELFDAWIMANLQDTPEVEAAGGFPMGYDTIDLNPFATPYGNFSIRSGIKQIYGARSAGNLPISRYYGGYLSGTVEYPIGVTEPYSPIYRGLIGAQPGVNLYVKNESESGVTPTDGENEAFSGSGNELNDRRLTLETSVPGGSTLTFKTWYDIEEEWDYGFVETSVDGGAWTPLAGSITTYSDNPNDSSAWPFALGDATETDAAITGTSDGWVPAEFVLPPGGDVQVRFSYYTDEYYNGSGWFIDELQVDGVSESFEGDLSAWDLGGWDVGSLIFDNDWVVGYANPSKGGTWSTGYLYPSPNEEGADVASAYFPTQFLGNDEIVVVQANRPRDEDAFSAGYVLLIGKRP